MCPARIRDVFYSVVSTNRTASSHVSLQHSWDGKRFSEFDHDASGGFPMDKQVSHSISGPDVPTGAKTAYFRSARFSFARRARITTGPPGIEPALSRPP